LARSGQNKVVAAGGLILSAADASYQDAPCENVLTLIEVWRDMADYPLCV
jgi:hypothetical protein